MASERISWARLEAKLPPDIVEWLQDIAEARGESLEDTLIWTLGLLQSYYYRWLRAIRTREEELLIEFIEWLKNKGVKEVRDLNEQHVYEFLEEAKPRKQAPETRSLANSIERRARKAYMIKT